MVYDLIINPTLPTKKHFFFFFLVNHSCKASRMRDCIPHCRPQLRFGFPLMLQEASIIILCLRHTQQRFSELFKHFLEINPLLLAPQIKRQHDTGKEPQPWNQRAWVRVLAHSSLPISKPIVFICKMEIMLILLSSQVHCEHQMKRLLFQSLLIRVFCCLQCEI